MSGRVFSAGACGVLAVLAALVPLPLSAEEESDGSTVVAAAEGDGFVELDAVVTEISFEGLKKTRESYLRPKFERFVGGTVAETDVHEVETALQAEGIFEEIDVSLERTGEGTARLAVVVKEKITFIPLPFAAYSSNGFMAGLMVMDTNAFGVKDTVVLGGFGSAAGGTGIALFAKPAGDDGSLGFSVSGSFSKSSPELKNLDEETALEYRSIGGGAKFSVSRKVGSAQTVRAGIAVAGGSYDEDDAWPSPLVESCVTGTLGVGWKISSVNWNGWFLSTSAASVSAESTWRLHTDAGDARRWGRLAEVSASFQQPVVFDRLRVFGRASGSWGADLPLSMWQGGSSVGTTLLPGDFRTERIAAASAGFEVALVRFGFGLVSVYGDYQVSVADDFSANGALGAEFCHGPDFGARLYLSKVAFPALAFGMSRNVPRGYWQYAFSLGMAF